jgi:hypothetical protein
MLFPYLAKEIAMRWIATAAFLTVMCGNALAIDCPIGSHPWVDTWGNQICKRFGDGSSTVIQGSTTNCPAGYHPSIDNWGNKTCQSFVTPSSPSQRSYDASQGCPIGTLPSVDIWGNQVCKSF